MKQKYISANVAKEIYCTSNICYYVWVSLKTADGKTRRVNYCINARDAIGRNGYLNLPRYVASMIDTVILDYHNQEQIIIHEYNQLGQKRYDNLRYHNATVFEYLVHRVLVDKIFK